MIAVMLLLAGCGAVENDQEKVAFAQCLTDSGFKMYGASWCGHCKKQKEIFGVKAFDSVDYVECTKQQTMCELAGVKAYPTWIGEGYRQSGVRSFDELAQASGCEYGSTDAETQENTEVEETTTDSAE